MLAKNRSGNNLSFTNVTGSNKLESVSVNGGTAQTFSWNENGTLSSDDYSNVTIPNNNYNQQKLPLRMEIPSEDTLNFRYNGNGERIIKHKESDDDKEYYLRDHTGRTLLIYDYDTDEPISLNIHGNGLIGKIKIDTTTDTKFYYAKDHLGNIRTTMRLDWTITSAVDYYPYGEEMREYINALDKERYKFTEKEPAKKPAGKRDKITNYPAYNADCIFGG